jgi:hypothetical protein
MVGVRWYYYFALGLCVCLYHLGNLNGLQAQTTKDYNFKISALLATGSRVAEHRAITGDDNGGIAASASQIFYTGANSSGGFALDDLSGGFALGNKQNAWVSDLATEIIYSLANGNAPLTNSGTATALVIHDGATGGPTTNVILLSQAIVMNVGSGIFSGYHRMVVHNGSRVYTIAVPSGEVTDLGAMTMPTHVTSKNWAFWGVAEFFDGNLYLAYVYNHRGIVRTRVPDGTTETIALFSDLGNMACFTVSIPRNRWYFHHAVASQFGGNQETIGYADAILDISQPTVPPEITMQPTNATVFWGTTAQFSVSAMGSVPLLYQWRWQGTNLAAETNASLNVTAFPENEGAYSVLISNACGSITSRLAQLTVQIVPPAILEQPASRTNLLGGTAQFSVVATSLPPAMLQWRREGIPLDRATNTMLLLTNVTLQDSGNYSLTVSNAFGVTLSSNALLSVVTLRKDSFKIVELRTSGAQVVDHFAVTGDDRGGIAISGSRVFLSGDAFTGGYLLSNLSDGIQLTGVVDGLVCDLSTATAYALAPVPVPYEPNGVLITELQELHGDTGLPTGKHIALSLPVPVGSTGVGVFSGWGQVVIHNRTNVYSIALPSGTVTDLGTMPMPTHQASDSWAFWGVAEYFSNAVHLVFTRGSRIERVRVPDGAGSVVANFNDLADMASFTISPAHNRWYFHYEGAGQFGGINETLGFAEAVFELGLVFPAHRMNIDPMTNGLQMSWPAAATGFTLESATSLASPAWESNAQPVTTNADKCVITIPMNTNHQFFRLRQTAP